ncbi:MAG: SpoIIE family protein phosphatase [Proteobacteria bacterium]|nr:SpoIIE family protein phosphatase [Pseudomonadota bacterium]
MLSKLIKSIYGSDDHLSHAEQAHLASLSRDHWSRYVLTVMLPSIVGMLIGSIAFWFLTPKGYQAYTTLPVLSCALVYTMVALIHLKRPILAQWLNMPLIGAYIQCLFIGNAISMSALRLHSDPDYFLMTCVVYVVFGVLALIRMPISNGWMLLFCCEFIVFGMAGWGPSIVSSKGLAWFLIISLFSLYAVAVNASIHRMTRLKNLADYAKMILLQQNESLRRQSMEEELTLARQLQESLAPPITFLACSQGNLRYFQNRHGVTSGDWIAFRELPSGELVVAVADVTGKGLPAAMVAQTIHGLWARMLDHSQFEARQWLDEVNKTLKAMSYSASHTATLGILVISNLSMTYYSCGHIPALVTYQTSSGLKFKTMMAKGSIVGMTADLDLEPVTLNFDELAVESILLGTDGVFPRISRIKTKHVQHLLHELSAHGESALANMEVEDDKMLVVIDRNKPARLI